MNSSSFITTRKTLVEMEASVDKLTHKKMSTISIITQPIIKAFSHIFAKLKFFLHESLEWSFGFLTMIVLLAFIAVIPILNFISLGYLVQMGANIAKSGKLMDGLVGIKKSATLGRMALGTWLCFWPVKLLFELKMAAQLTEVEGTQFQLFSSLAFIGLFLTFLHVFWACLRGGKIIHFLWPAPLKFYRWLKEEHLFKSHTQAIKAYFSDMHIKNYFILGFKTFVGAFIWLFPPIALMIFSSFLPPAGILLSLPAGLALMWVILHLPFLQIHCALEQNFKAMFDFKAIRDGFKKAPLISWLALFITLLFALPLYLLKIELTPEEVAWLPSILFVFFIFPARLLVGYAMYHSQKRSQASHWSFKWLARLGVIPVLLAYVVLVFITQYLSWYGSFSLLEQHAFLVPAPILGL